MPENSKEGFSNKDIISLAQIKQTLVVLGAVVSLVVIIFPVILSRLYTKLDSIDTNTLQVATIQVQITTLQRDIDRIMLWVDRERDSKRVATTGLIASEVCIEGCSLTLARYADQEVYYGF